MKNTFSKSCKTETLDNFKFSKNDCCNASFLKGYFFRENITPDMQSLRHKPDIFKSAKVVKKLMSRYDINSYVIEKEPRNKEPMSVLYITEPESLQRLYTLQENICRCDDCPRHFLTGLFVSDGVVNDPSKGYKLEFSYKDEDKAKKIDEILKENDFDFKLTKRKNSFVVYTGNSNTIEIFLATVGAQLSFLQLVSDKVEKDINNKNNRVANFGNANMEKTKNAGKKVLEAITKLIDTELLYELPEDLQEIAQLKLENPLRSLETLGKMCSEPMTKSSVNRRLQKLCDLAQIEE